jgi:hypothetical protein
MEYHKERFEDFSLMVFKDEKLIALLPANKNNNEVNSHQGLTYGGLVISKNIKFDHVLEAFKAVLKFLQENHINTLILKQLPSIYTLLPSEEINYLMFVLDAKLFRRDTMSVIDLNEKLKISNIRNRGVKQAQKLHLTVKEESNFDSFWNEILIANLKERHNVKPIHSLEEITLLKKRFPKNIRQFNVYNKDKIVAGTTIFETETVAHSQYISGKSESNQLGGLDFLFLYLINDVYKNKKFFDFGISNENEGRQINRGLQYWKEGFGGRTVTQDFYKIQTENHKKLNDVFI